MRSGRKNTTSLCSLILLSLWCKHWTQSIENHFSDFVSEWALIMGQLLRALLVIKSLQCEWQKELIFLFSLLRCSKTAIWYLVKYRWALNIFLGAFGNYVDSFVSFRSRAKIINNVWRALSLTSHLSFPTATLHPLPHRSVYVIS